MLVAATQLVSWMSLAKNETSDETIQFCKVALSMTERLLGPDHPDVAAGSTFMKINYIVQLDTQRVIQYSVLLLVFVNLRKT